MHFENLWQLCENHVSPGMPSLEFWFFFCFFPLNWAVKLETFRLNLRLNSLVVPYWAQKRARVAKKRPILCNMTVWFSSGSFFKRISVFAYYFSAHSESREWWTWYFENWKKARLTEYKIRPMDLECALKWYTNALKNYKKEVLRALRTILHRIGRFLATLARFCAQ